MSMPSQISTYLVFKHNWIETTWFASSKLEAAFFFLNSKSTIAEEPVLGKLSTIAAITWCL